MKRRRWYAPKPHYTMFPVTLASTKRVRTLSPAAKRMLIFLNLLWRPDKPIVLPVHWAAERLRVKPETVSAALAELSVARLIERTREHVPPGSGRNPRAAEYRLIHRQKSRYEANQKPGQPDRTGVRAVLDHGDEIRVGYIQMLDDDLLPLLCDLTNAEFEVLWMAAFRNHERDHFGAISGNPVLTVTGLGAVLPQLPARTLRHSVQSLIRRGHLKELMPAAGRRPARLAPTGVTAAGLPWAPRRTERATIDPHRGMTAREPKQSTQQRETLHGKPYMDGSY